MPDRGAAFGRALAVGCGLIVLAGLACRPAGDGTEARGAGPVDGRGPAPVDVGDPSERLADVGGRPVVDEDDCGLAVPADGPRLDPGRAASDTSEWARETVSFAVTFGDEVNPHRLMSAFVLPGEELEIAPVLTDGRARFRVEADAGTLARTGPERWTWTAPDEPGAYCLEITDVGGDPGDETMCLNAFVLTPWDGSETLNGYRIGSYPDELYRDREGYRPPRGFVEVTPETEEAWVSPHFQLGQFVCKQESGYPKYLHLSTRLLLKLETLLAQVRDEGIPAESFYVMSGYRTPFYNRAIGNTTTFSRHTLGDAADIFVDRNRNGVMDDLDGDGRVSVDDARVLYRLIDASHGQPWYRPFVGGLGLYGPTPHRGPFIHVDTRGYRARW